ncbi:MAG: hypothetical protein QN122_12015 [Armatimonadota bacterium]|nr:hypothetical protein [Armatimonadota bacterium]
MAGPLADDEFILGPPAPDPILRRWTWWYLANLGFTDREVEQLMAAGADPHAAEALIRRGCPHHLAVEILR